MATLYHIWNPTRLSESRIVFDVTAGDSPQVRSGGAEWMAACLDSIGVSASAESWSIQPARSYYYFSNPDTDVWEDRWLPVWRINVTLDGEAPSSFGPLDWISVGDVQERDPTWHPDQEPSPEHDRTALLIMIHKENKSAVNWLRDYLRNKRPEDWELKSASIFADKQGFARLEAVVHADNLFPDHIEALESILEKSRRRGGAVNRYDLIALKD